MNKSAELTRLKTTKTQSALTFGGSLAPYTGPFDRPQVLHLLRRTTFALTPELSQEAENLGLERSLDKLLEDTPLPNPPVIYDDKDSSLNIGDVWIDSKYPPTGNSAIGSRRRSLYAWVYKVIKEEGFSAREKMVLFWHNHFATEQDIVRDPKFSYRSYDLYRRNAFGNFKELVKEVTIDPGMLRYLNGHDNQRRSPNENYARELLELFTIGKGPIAGSGDYTNYTEEDIAVIARALTGWRHQGYLARNETAVGSNYVKSRHDQDDKQLSHRFDNQVIANKEDKEYAEVVDIIFQKTEVARHICRKLYRYFVFSNIDATVEQTIIEPLAQQLIAENWTVRPVLRTLLGSQHFFDHLLIGPMIKNPMDFMMTLVKTIPVSLPTEIDQEYFAYLKMHQAVVKLQLDYVNPPDVAGWKAYYQEPSFYRTWTNSVTLVERQSLVEGLFGRGLFIGGGRRVQPDILSLIAKFKDPGDPNTMILELVELLLPQPITDSQLATLKEVLIPGLPDFEWTVEYNEYLSNRNDDKLRESVQDKLRILTGKILSLAEAHLC